MKKTIFIPLGLLALSLALGLWTIQGLRSSQEKIKSLGIEPVFQFPQLPELREFISPEEEENGYREFIDAEGKFKINYPAGWLEVTKGEALGALTPEDWKEKYDLKTLLWAQGLEEEKLGQLIVYQGQFDIGIGEIIEAMKESNKKNGWLVETLRLDVKGREGILEAKYQIPGNGLLHSLEKILATNGRAYLIAYFVFEKDWPELSSEAEFVINSAQLLDKD